MALRIITALITLWSIFLPSVFAQETVKRSLFEDCEQASREFSDLTVEQQMSLSDFFARVVALNTQSPAAPEAFVAGPGVPAGGDPASLSAPKSSELVTGALWQGLDAKRELRAKRCALELLRVSGGLAMSALPTLVETYSNQALSDEMAVGLEETVADVAERAHKQGISPSSEQCSLLSKNLFAERPLAASIVLQEFLTVCLPQILRSCPGNSPQSKTIKAWLQEVNPSGEAAMRILIESAPTLSPETLSELASHVPLPSKAALTQFVGDFVALASNPQQAPVFLSFLGKACSVLGGLTIDATQQSSIASLGHLLSPDLVSSEDAACLIGAAPGAAKQLPAMIAPATPDAQALFALEVADVAFPNLSTEMRSELCTRTKERAVLLEIGTADRSLDFLKRCAEQRSENSQLPFLLLKSLDTVQDPRHRDDLFAQILSLLEVTGLGKDKNRFASLISPHLRSPAPSHAVLKIASQIPSLAANVLRQALEVPPSPSSIAALEVLLSNRSFPAKSIPALVELLRYPEVQGVGESLLQTLGTAAVAPLRKAAARPLWSGRTSALSSLIGLKVATKGEISDFAATLSSAEGCSFVNSHSRTICSLSTRPKQEQLHQAHITSAVHRCVNEMTRDQLSLIADCNPAALTGALDSLTSLVSSQGDQERLEPVVSLCLKDSTRNQAKDAFIGALLERGSQTTVLRILTHLAAEDTLPPELLAAVRSVAERNRDTQEVFLKALHVIARHAPSSYDWAPFVKNAIQIGGRGSLPSEVLSILTLVPTEPVLAYVVPALESETPEKLVGGAIVGAALGPKAIPIVSRLWHLREAKAPLVRTVAVLALLQVNPLTPDLQSEVSKLLVNRYFPIAERLPIKWGETVAVVDMDRSSFGDLRRSRLEHLLTPKA